MASKPPSEHITEPRDDQELAEQGKEILALGKLRELRDKLGLSTTVQAYMIGVQPIQLRFWEKGASAPSRRSAIKINNWYEGAMDKLGEVDVAFEDLVHLSVASQYLGISYAAVMDWCARDLLQCLDLGELGLYVPRHQVVTLSK